MQTSSVGSIWGTRRNRTQRTIVARKLAAGAGHVELDATDAAEVIVLGHVPAPGGNGVPSFDVDFHADFSL